MSQIPKFSSQANHIAQPERKETLDRTPHHSNPSQSANLTRVSKSIRLALYLYISAHYELRETQLEYIAHFQARLNLAQILKAMKFVHVLTTDSRTRARMKISEVVYSRDGKTIREGTISGKVVPSANSRPKIREQRRIGVGYRDKGSLPKSSFSWDKDNTINLGESYESETAHWNYNLLRDPSESSDSESDEVKSNVEEPRNARVNLLGNQLTEISNTGNVWCITTRKITFASLSQFPWEERL